MRWGVLASEAIRVSLGWGTIEADVDSFAGAWESAAGRLTRRRAA
jgi:cysteine sulfinate desulfinase/cysteine desulfurase-like protein